MSTPEGAAAVADRIADLMDAIGESAAKSVLGIAEDVRTDAVVSIQKTSTGRQVTRTTQGGNEYKHTAAAAGEAPNTDTGALVRSIGVEIGAGAAYVFSDLKYAKWLELGARRMAPRPFLLPALEKNRHKMVDAIVDGIKKALK